jgi:hypothetical protein
MTVTARPQRSATDRSPRLAVLRERLIWVVSVPLALLGVVGLLLLGAIEVRVYSRSQEAFEEMRDDGFR